MTTIKANFVRRVIKNALRIRCNEIEVIAPNAYLIPLNYQGPLEDGNRFRNDSMQVTVLDGNLLIVNLAA